MSSTVVSLSRVIAGAALAVTLSAAPLLADEAKIKRGQEVYTAQKCQMCHAIEGKGNKMNPLDGVGSKLSAEDTKAWIVDPVGMTKKTQSKAKPPMPNRYSKLPPADIDAMVTYMQSLKKK